MNYTHYSVNGALVREFIDHSADTVKWLADKGVKYDGVVAYYKGAHFVWHIRSHESPTVTDAIMNSIRDVNFHYNCAVLELTLDEGRITGFTGVTSEGMKIVVKAKAVIIASGGLARKGDLVWELTGVRLGQDVNILSNPGAFTANAIARQKGATAFMIFGTTIKEYYDEFGYKYRISNPPKQEAPDLEGYIEEAKADGYPFLFKA